MGALLPVISLFVILIIGLLVTRVATVALTLTGLSHDVAHFQALSAYMGVGFTSHESEHVLEHPVRRRIIKWLILAGNAGLIAAVSALIPVFVMSGNGASGFFIRMLWLASSLILLWALANSRWIDRRLSSIVAKAIKRWTRIEIWDYPSLLQLSEGYTVTEVHIEPHDWVMGKTLTELRLSDEGVHVLGIRRADGEYLGTPTGRTFIRKGDTLIVYGKVEHITDLHNRKADANGDMAHAARVHEQYEAIEEQEQHDRKAPRDEAAEEPLEI